MNRKAVERFRAWWPRQGIDTQEAIREIIDTPDPARTAEITRQCDEVLDLLNRLTGRHYRKTAANRGIIRRRLKDSSLKRCKAVVALKCRQARENRFPADKCRPATLFRPLLFEQYIAELPSDTEENPKNGHPQPDLSGL